MSAAAIDLNTLNDLIDNQKKLDDIFSSIFDEDPFFKKDGDDSYSQSLDSFEQDFSVFDIDDEATVQQKQNIAFLVVPVMLEIGIFYYGIMYLF